MRTDARFIRLLGATLLILLLAACTGGARTGPGTVETSSSPADLERANPLIALPAPPLGIDVQLAALPDPPTEETVRLGRWLFYDPRLSVDATVSCATCHRPEHGFSEPTPVSTGVDGKRGTRKAPPVLNAVANIERHQFWDGRAATLEEQAAGPMINPVEMAMPGHDVVTERVGAVARSRWRCPGTTS